MASEKVSNDGRRRLSSCRLIAVVLIDPLDGFGQTGDIPGHNQHLGKDECIAGPESEKKHGDVVVIQVLDGRKRGREEAYQINCQFLNIINLQHDIDRDFLHSLLWRITVAVIKIRLIRFEQLSSFFEGEILCSVGMSARACLSARCSAWIFLPTKAPLSPVDRMDRIGAKSTKNTICWAPSICTATPIKNLVRFVCC